MRCLAICNSVLIHLFCARREEALGLGGGEDCPCPSQPCISWTPRVRTLQAAGQEHTPGTRCLGDIRKACEQRASAQWVPTFDTRLAPDQWEV